ncbi:MAG: hypothetical protein N2235_22840 [Fischerella sp.]|nr:hypothetical protein [Fischerella sp.]
MENTAQNPLIKHFRQPAIYITLPSRGNFWDPSAINLPPTGEIPVYPMTTKDEILIRTPDALMNGQGVVDVIQSCVPNIKNAWAMPSVDVDAVLIAIRIASYGNEMEIDAKCPKCGESHKYGMPLGEVLSKIQCPNYDKPVEDNGLKIYLHPQNYFSLNETNQRSYQEQQLMRTLTDPNLDEKVKIAEFSKQIARIVELNIKVIVDSTACIVTNEGVTVTDPRFIQEFYENSSKQVIDKIKKQLEKNSTDASVPPFNVKCSECQEDFVVPVTFDYSSFFGQSS